MSSKFIRGRLLGRGHSKHATWRRIKKKAAAARGLWALGNAHATALIQISNGKYVLFGLGECLRRSLDEKLNKVPHSVVIQVYVDGLSLHRSSLQQLWPILGRVVQPVSLVFITGLYCGMEMPLNVHAYLDEFTREPRVILAPMCTNVRTDSVSEYYGWCISKGQW